MFIHTVCKELEKAHVPYAIVGGYAVALHGALRGTIDIDIVIQWTEENLKKAEKALEKLGLVSLLPIDAHSVFSFRDEYIQNRNLIAWNFYDPHNQSRQVDIIINYDLKKGKSKTIDTEKGKLKILSISELIKMKKKSGRPQDLEDIKALKTL